MGSLFYLQGTNESLRKTDPIRSSSQQKENCRSHCRLTLSFLELIERLCLIRNDHVSDVVLVLLY